MEQNDLLDITPSKRVLRMLGQIDFKAWQCLAELIDNSVDAFLKGREAGHGPMFPEVSVEVSSRDQIQSGNGEIRITDNAAGMSVQELQNAVRAGYSGNNSIDKLGLFGMGFNIATARLGDRTEVWTTTTDAPEWYGIRIDFDELETSDSWLTPLHSRPKLDGDPQQHGTEVVISKLDAERVLYMRTPGGARWTRENLTRVYGKIIRETGLRLSILNQTLSAREFCLWDRTRTVDTGSRFGRVPAWLPIDADYGERDYCMNCWVWLLDREDVCPSCNSANALARRSRVVKGWLGIQRFFDTEDYGIDLVRNGRVIERRTKYLFSWEDESGDIEREYPVDQIYWGGRIVGEVDCDFVPLASHQKDSFDKTSREWQLVVEAIRGRGPILQHLRTRLQYPDDNTSPLARLQAGFRRGQPAGTRWLVPGDATGKGFNVPAQQWAAMFWAGDPEYQTDEKWYEAVLTAEKGRTANRGADVPPEVSGPDLIGLPGESPDVSEDPTDVTPSAETVQPEDFVIDEDLSFDASLPDLPGAPVLHVTTQRLLRGTLDSSLHVEVAPVGNNIEILYDANHAFFTETLAAPVDCILEEVAYQLLRRSTTSQRDWPISRIAYELRKRYFVSSLASVEDIRREATALLDELIQHYVEALSALSPLPLDELSEKDTQELAQSIARRERAGMERVTEVISAGTYPAYMGHRWTVNLLERRPELALDGQFFSVSYSDVDPALREDLVQQVIVPIKDLVWVVQEGQLTNSDTEWRSLLARAYASIRLLSIWRS